jgi:hypothetical protein
MKAQDSARHGGHAAWAAGPLAVALGASAHLVVGEAVPGPWVLLALTALISMGASMLARLNVPMWALFLLSGVVQQLLHLSFAGFSGDGGGASSGHPHESYVWQQPQLAPASGGHHAIELMLDTHVAAALLTVLIITQSTAVTTKTALALKSVGAGFALKHPKAR